MRTETCDICGAEVDPEVGYWPDGVFICSPECLDDYRDQAGMEIHYRHLTKSLDRDAAASANRGR